jgi:hypothetical protein
MAHNRKGQVTIFIILGILILAGAVFLFVLSSALRTSQLETAQEEILTGVFEKEGLRIFVEDCLADGIEEGLILIGSQGRLWADDPGGTLAFSEGINGLLLNTISGDHQIYYGLTYREDFEFPNNYPCLENSTNPPAFCKYTYDDLGHNANFGHQEQLGIRDIERDLSRYLESDTASCVQELIAANLSISSSIRQDDLDISVNLEPEGIKVHAVYPLELYVDGSSYFHLTDFDFFYPSQLQSFLRTAITLPLRNEGQDVDFKYSEEDLLLSGMYQGLSAHFTQFNVSGDRILQFIVDSPKILQHSNPYVFRFALENRPPALDYVSRKQCGGYDYLVVPGSEREEGDINITPVAHDPDDQTPIYTFDHSFENIGMDVTGIEIVEGVLEENQTANLFFDVPFGFPANIYNITVTSMDEFGAKDWQDVRVLIDNSVEVGISIATPYNDSSQYDLTTQSFAISTEDPVYITINMPEVSIVSDAVQTLTLDYANGDVEIIPQTVIPLTGDEINCISLPNTQDETEGSYQCGDPRYNQNIEDWKNIFVPSLSLPYFQKTTNPADEPGSAQFGELTLTFSSNYCSVYETAPEVEEILFKVQECIPHRNATNPYAFPYNTETFEIDEDGKKIYLGTFDSDPFLAGHSCCNDDGTYSSADTSCYTSQPGCYGGQLDWTLGNEGYVIEIEQDFCSGERGNVCGNSGNAEYELLDQTLRCGNSSMDSCLSVDTKCENSLAWGNPGDIGGDNGWCHGKMGCENFCPLGKEVVYRGTIDTIPGSINEMAKEIHATSDDFNTATFNFDCGCTQEDADLGRKCDGDFDGNFDGVCILTDSIYTCSENIEE